MSEECKQEVVRNGFSYGSWRQIDGPKNFRRPIRAGEARLPDLELIKVELLMPVESLQPKAIKKVQ
jgi:hypothetical protein